MSCRLKHLQIKDHTSEQFFMLGFRCPMPPVTVVFIDICLFVMAIAKQVWLLAFLWGIRLVWYVAPSWRNLKVGCYYA